MIRKDSWYDFSLLKFAKICFLAYFSYNVGDLGSIPGLGRSSGEGNGNLLQYSCLENPMNRGAWWATGSQRVEHNWATSLHFTSLWSLLESIPGPLENNVYSVMLNETFWMCLLSLFLLKYGSMFKMYSIAVFPYWFCLDNRATADSGILKSPKITVVFYLSFKIFYWLLIIF